MFIKLIFVEGKALKLAHSRLRNFFSNAAISKKPADRNPYPWSREVYT
ncbi:hypothetical protein BMETH_20_3 [methanotrophic bacterial endosymbiont of Bathymodiolus sp.]|nr:hypothetical protein BMETH_20_3 [methanotrophic bacterial endosymbiont of Bathymodiolus sp.]